MTTFVWTPRKHAGTLTAQDVADAVWDAQTSDHAVSGSFGSFVKRLLTVGKFLGLQ